MRDRYVALGLALGTAVGGAMGVASDNVGLWLVLGASFGIALGGDLRRNLT